MIPKKPEPSKVFKTRKGDYIDKLFVYDGTEYVTLEISNNNINWKQPKERRRIRLDKSNVEALVELLTTLKEEMTDAEA